MEVATGTEFLNEHIDEIVGRMPAEFTSHAFINTMMSAFQHEFAVALVECGEDNPFMKLHGKIARRLHNVDGIEYIRHVPSKDIFGASQMCGLWRRI